MNEQIIEFLTELRSHNNREWFQDNKSRYDALRKVFIDEVQDLIGRISLFDPEVAGLVPATCAIKETSSGYIRSYRGIYGYYRGTYI